MNVRQATTKDIPHIIKLYKAGLDELGYNDYTDKLLMKKVTESFVTAPCFLLVDDVNIYGMAGMTLAVTSHNGVATLMDYMFYIEPDKRSIDNLGGLIEEIKQFATANDFPIKLEFICNDDLELKKRVFKRFGFTVHSVTGVIDAA